MISTIEDIDSGGFRFDLLLAFHCGLLWLKVTFLLKLTRLFGPLIKIVTNMLGDIIEFCVLWFVSLLFFSCVGMLLFAEVPEYDNLYLTMVMFI